MSEYKTVIEWSRDGAVFTDKQYSRGHRWMFDGGIEVAASSSPSVVPLPLSVAVVDPEEAFVASLSSCHMLVFLSIAAMRGLVVDSYRDEAIGMLEKDSSGKLAITRVTLHPKGRVQPEISAHRQDDLTAMNTTNRMSNVSSPARSRPM